MTLGLSAHRIILDDRRAIDGAQFDQLTVNLV
jgi:hypothetical protein